MNLSQTNYKITPLRSSTIKTVDNQQSIQSHFTYVTRPSAKRQSKPIFEQEQETFESLCPSEKYLSSPNQSSSSSEFSEPDFYLLPRLGAGACGIKRSMPSDDGAKKQPRLVPMGTRIQMHPRFKKTRYAEAQIINTEELGPVCSIPLPNLFMIAPNPITIQKPTVNTETQTTPSDVSSCSSEANNKTPIISHRRARKDNSRRSSGANVLAGIKTAFGTIRRAISAERLDQITNSQEETDIKPSNVTPKLKQKVLMSPKKFVMNRSRTSSSNYSPIPVVAEESLNEISASEKLTCKVIKHYQDGSKHIQLERSSLKTPFGFYISKDEDGIYVSKLGNSKNISNLLGQVKVGDRLKFIQGIDGFTADVGSIKAMVKEDLRLDLIIKTPKRF